MATFLPHVECQTKWVSKNAMSKKQEIIDYLNGEIEAQGRSLTDEQEKRRRLELAHKHCPARLSEAAILLQEAERLLKPYLSHRCVRQHIANSERWRGLAKPEA